MAETKMCRRWEAQKNQHKKRIKSRRKEWMCGYNKGLSRKRKQIKDLGGELYIRVVRQKQGAEPPSVPGLHSESLQSREV